MNSQRTQTVLVPIIPQDGPLPTAENVPLFLPELYQQQQEQHAQEETRRRARQEAERRTRALQTGD